MIEQRLLEIWKKFQGQMPSERLNDILKRGICYSQIDEPHRILVAGINPSFRQGDAACDKYICAYDYQGIIKKGNDQYFHSFNALFPEKYREEVAYLDILNYRETEQKVLYDFYKTENGLEFIAENLELNQLYIEQIIKPQLIMVKNHASWDLWGKNATATENIWMGYRLELMETFPCGDLCRIIGLIEHPGRVSYRSLLETAMKGTLVLFTNHFQYCSKEKHPTPELMAHLCARL